MLIVVHGSKNPVSVKASKVTLRGDEGEEREGCWILLEDESRREEAKRTTTAPTTQKPPWGGKEQKGKENISGHEWIDLPC